MTVSAEGPVELIIAEYESLRGEILKLIELQSQLVSLAVVALGTILSFGLQARNSVLVFVYPFLSLMLGISWLNHSHAISRCAAYLSLEFESRCGHSVLGWENYVRRNPLRFGMLGYWGVRSVFMGSSVTAFVAGIILLRGTAVEMIAATTSCLVTASTILLFVVWREPSPRKLLKDERARTAQAEG
ncbi:MAG: hypothetical protein M3Q39_07605 [Actinomycetota bacterium]|nr:hypothetical protein [Actinomycetota bacterium]